MPRQDSQADILADVIGEYFARKIREETTTREIQYVGFGGADQLAFSDFKSFLPGVFIRPTGQSAYNNERDVSATQFEITDTFRFSVAALYGADENPEVEVAKIARTCVRVLRGNRKLEGIDWDKTKYRVNDSNTLSVDWDPFENDLFRSNSLPIRVISVMHYVRWYTR